MVALARGGTSCGGLCAQYALYAGLDYAHCRSGNVRVRSRVFFPSAAASKKRLALAVGGDVFAVAFTPDHLRRFWRLSGDRCTNPHGAWGIFGIQCDQEDAGVMMSYTVVMALKNAAHTLPACLESLQAQTVAPSALFAVDRASTDGSGDRLREGYKDAVVLRYAHDSGWASAIMAAVKLACRRRQEALLVLGPESVLDARCAEELLHTLASGTKTGVAAPHLFALFDEQPQDEALHERVASDRLLSAGFIKKRWCYFERGNGQKDDGRFNADSCVLAVRPSAFLLHPDLVLPLAGQESWLEERASEAVGALLFGAQVRRMGWKVQSVSTAQAFLPQGVYRGEHAQTFLRSVKVGMRARWKLRM